MRLLYVEAERYGGDQAVSGIRWLLLKSGSDLHKRTGDVVGHPWTPSVLAELLADYLRTAGRESEDLSSEVELDSVRRPGGEAGSEEVLVLGPDGTKYDPYVEPRHLAKHDRLPSVTRRQREPTPTFSGQSGPAPDISF